MSPGRSARPTVRNPVLALRQVVAIKAMPAEVRQELADLLLNLRADAAVTAEKCWKKHKAPMATYWKCVAVYAGHIARAIRPRDADWKADAGSLAVAACREMIHGDGSVESQQRAINLARQALGLK